MKFNKEGIITECSIPFKIHLIPFSNTTSRSGKKMTPSTITIHNTANPNADAEDNSVYVDKASGYVSWHFTIGDNIVYQELPIYEHSWHAGDGEFGKGNLTSIAIEVSEEEGEKAYETAIKFVAELLIALGWGTDKLRPHQYWSGKYCPRLILPKWDSDFIPRIHKKMGEMDKMDERIDIEIKVSGKIIKDLEKKTIEDVSLYLDNYEVVKETEILYSYIGYNLKKGMYNDVNNAKLQEILKELGYYNMPIDNHFGNGMHNAVINFQVERDLDVTGIVTEKIAYEINKALVEKRSNLNTPSKPYDSEFDNFVPLVKLTKSFGYYTRFGQTRLVQFALNEIDRVKYDIEVDGHFGRGTQSALNAYKKSKGMVQDGLVDQLTWKHLHFDLWKKQEYEDLKINWYDNQTKIIRIKKDAVDLDVIIGHQPTETVTSLYRRLEEKPLLLTNGTMYGMRNGVTLGLVVDEGNEFNFGVYSKWALAQRFNGEIDVLGMNWEKQIGTYSTVKEAVGASPSLIIGGKENLDNTGLDYGFIHDKHPRLVHGLDDEYLYIIVVHGRNAIKGYYGENIKGLVYLCLDLKLVDAINVDGGGSIIILDENGNRVDDNTGIRSVDNMIAYYHRA